MNKKLLILLVLVALVYYLNQEKSNQKPNQSLLSNEPWIIPKTVNSVQTSVKKESTSLPSRELKKPAMEFLSIESPETDYSWLTDDNLEFILKNWTPVKTALAKPNQTQRKFSLRTDLANIYNCFYKAKTSQDWDLPEFLQAAEFNKAQHTLFPLRVNGNHWGLFILQDLAWQETESIYQVHYTSSGGGDLSEEKKQLQPFINQIIGENTPITIIQPKDRNSKGRQAPSRPV